MSTEARAQAEALRYAHGFKEMSIVKLMVEIGVPEALEQRGGPMTLSELSSATGTPEASLYRIMRFLSRRGIFKQQICPTTSAITYAPTLISRHLTMDKLGICTLLQWNPKVAISAADLRAGKGSGLEPGSTVDEFWSPEAEEEEYHKILHKALVNQSRAAASAMVKYAPETFQEIGLLVDIGGRAGTALGILVKAFPWIRGINFDLSHVVAKAPAIDGVVHVGGDMFKDALPQADAMMLMRILHDWGDLACIEILKKCKEAIPMDKGKVIIVEAILDEDNEEERDEFSVARLLNDMTIMMATAHGKERTAKEWAKLIKTAGFRRHSVKHMQDIVSVIEAYP